MALTAAALAEARDATLATGARFAVVIAPGKEAVYWQGTAAAAGNAGAQRPLAGAGV